MSDINYPELKEKILLEFASSFVDISLYYFRDQYPISAVYVLPNLFKFKEDIFSVIEKNINTYHEVMLAQILQLLSYKEMNTPAELYNLVLDELISRRKDPTLKESFDLNYLKELNLSEATNFSSLKKYILWAEMNIDIEYPIFRGFGFNIYTTVNDRFYKEYNLPTGKFIYSCYMNEKPVYYITGHNRKPGFLNDYKFYGVLPSQPKHIEFKNDKDKIKYAVDKILSHLDINKTIDKKDIIVDIDNNIPNPEDVSDEDKETSIQETYNILKELCGI